MARTSEKGVFSAFSPYRKMFAFADRTIVAFQTNPGDVGWDVFSLFYRVDGPIASVSDGFAKTESDWTL